jgi:molybdopterin-guanine dinucleotide biosynthesis protein A
VRADQVDDPLRSAYPQIVDRWAELGPVAGILSAQAEIPDADWLVVACDLPNLDRKTLSHLMEQAPLEAPLVAYRSTVDGLPEPLCALYRAGSAGLLRNAVERGIRCPRKILIRNEALLLELPHRDALVNVNTPDELAVSLEGRA